MVDMALAASFLAVHILYKFRNHLGSRTPPGVDVVADVDAPEDRLMVEWIEAVQKRSALLSELDKPTVSRKCGTQTKLLNEIRTSGAKCHSLLVALRAHRKARRHSG
jgi:hypothetical protein